MVSRWKFWLVSFFFLFGPAIFASSSAQVLPKKDIILAGKKLKVEVAETRQQQETGLMYREKMGADQGMLFIFKNEETRFFWMKNTFIDLDIGYFDKDGTLVDIQEMKSGKGVPDSALPSYPSSKPARYALEMNKGWFQKNKIKLGDKLTIP